MTCGLFGARLFFPPGPELAPGRGPRLPLDAGQFCQCRFGLGFVGMEEGGAPADPAADIFLDLLQAARQTHSIQRPFDLAECIYPGIGLSSTASAAGDLTSHRVRVMAKSIPDFTKK